MRPWPASPPAPGCTKGHRLTELCPSRLHPAPRNLTTGQDGNRQIDQPLGIDIPTAQIALIVSALQQLGFGTGQERWPLDGNLFCDTPNRAQQMVDPYFAPGKRRQSSLRASASHMKF